MPKFFKVSGGSAVGSVGDINREAIAPESLPVPLLMADIPHGQRGADWQNWRIVGKFRLGLHGGVVLEMIQECPPV